MTCVNYRDSGKNSVSLSKFNFVQGLGSGSADVQMNAMPGIGRN